MKYLIYRPDIDGLRAIAVLSVIGFHIFPNNVVGGFVGVDIFFVISGFLISAIIFKHLDKDDFSFFNFIQEELFVYSRHYLLFFFRALCSDGLYYFRMNIRSSE